MWKTDRSRALNELMNIIGKFRSYDVVICMVLMHDCSYCKGCWIVNYQH